MKESLEEVINSMGDESMKDMEEDYSRLVESEIENNPENKIPIKIDKPDPKNNTVSKTGLWKVTFSNGSYTIVHSKSMGEAKSMINTLFGKSAVLVQNIEEANDLSISTYKKSGCKIHYVQ